MNVRVLVEDTSSSAEYLSEHGLSLYIETRKHRLIFDFGQSACSLRTQERWAWMYAGLIGTPKLGQPLRKICWWEIKPTNRK